MSVIPAIRRRAAYHCISDWLLLAVFVWGGGWVIVQVWNLRMGV